MGKPHRQWEPQAPKPVDAAGKKWMIRVMYFFGAILFVREECVKSYFPEHSRNKRQSTQNQHLKNQARRRRQHGDEDMDTDFSKTADPGN
ncbi:hypothetical protein UY3_06465 [Chelonia mydas]|uniref:Uncharacterized protein n=1 Tax=Chelonia mydas TaxID=8469 RepID=M7BWC3_CHEMY|nr:hypothetical protein UY3_06465 [Chelonia mydas]